MKLFPRTCVLSLVLPAAVASCVVMSSHAQAVTEIGGQKIVTLTRTATSKTKPEFTSVTVLPGRGMELLQITANFPGSGNVDVLASPDLAAAKKMLDEEDNANGDLGYRLGSAFLVPYPNRIRGKLSADGKTLTTEWQGHTITLPANNIGKNPGAERHAMHGLILKAKTDDVKVKTIFPAARKSRASSMPATSAATGSPRPTSHFTITLTADAVDAIVDGQERRQRSRARSPSDGIPTSTSLRRPHPGPPADSRPTCWPRWTTTTTSFPPASSCPSRGQYRSARTGRQPL